jgi:nicotinamide-nucleotide amidase
MKAEIISIGTELLLGEITDTNSSFIASQLPLLGIDLYFISTVGDNHQRLINTLKQAWQRSDIIITTGGLGPTQGDITRESIADLLQEELTIDTILVQKLREFFCHRKLDMPESNIKQAAVIQL